MALPLVPSIVAFDTSVFDAKSGNSAEERGLKSNVTVKLFLNVEGKHTQVDHRQSNPSTAMTAMASLLPETLPFARGEVPDVPVHLPYKECAASYSYRSLHSWCVRMRQSGNSTCGPEGPPHATFSPLSFKIFNRRRCFISRV